MTVRIDLPVVRRISACVTTSAVGGGASLLVIEVIWLIMSLCNGISVFTLAPQNAAWWSAAGTMIASVLRSITGAAYSDYSLSLNSSLPSQLCGQSDHVTSKRTLCIVDQRDKLADITREGNCHCSKDD